MSRVLVPDVPEHWDLAVTVGPLLVTLPADDPLVVAARLGLELRAALDQRWAKVRPVVAEDVVSPAAPGMVPTTVTCEHIVGAAAVCPECMSKKCPHPRRIRCCWSCALTWRRANTVQLPA